MRKISLFLSTKVCNSFMSVNSFVVTCVNVCKRNKIVCPVLAPLPQLKMYLKNIGYNKRNEFIDSNSLLFGSAFFYTFDNV